MKVLKCSRPYPIHVPNITLNEFLIKGKYNRISSIITAKNPIVSLQKDSGIVTKVTSVNGKILTDDLLELLRLENLRAANIQEILAFGATHHELPQQFPIAGLGSLLKGRDRYKLSFSPFLARINGKRILSVGCRSEPWQGYFTFLAVEQS